VPQIGSIVKGKWLVSRQCAVSRLLAGSRDQGAGSRSREQGAGSRKQGAGSGQAAGRKQGAGAGSERGGLFITLGFSHFLLID